MTDFREFLRREARLEILRILAQLPGYRTNNAVLLGALRELGHNPSRDQLRAELQWLAEQGLIAVEELAPAMIATLLGRGADVAEGRATVPGVQRPGA